MGARPNNFWGLHLAALASVSCIMGLVNSNVPRFAFLACIAAWTLAGTLADWSISSLFFFCRLKIKQICAGVSRSNLNFANPEALLASRLLAVRLSKAYFTRSKRLNVRAWRCLCFHFWVDVPRKFRHWFKNRRNVRFPLLFDSVSQIRMSFYLIDFKLWVRAKGLIGLCRLFWL